MKRVNNNKHVKVVGPPKYVDKNRNWPTLYDNNVKD